MTNQGWDAQQWSEILQPLITFSSLLILVAMLLWYKYKKKQLFLQTVERALQHDKALTPEAIDAMARQLFAQQADIRKGLFLLALAGGIRALSAGAQFRDNGGLNLNDALNGIAVFPLLLGLAYLLLGYLQRQRRT